VLHPGQVEIASTGFRTDLMVLALGGSEVTDRGDLLVVRTPANPSYWWGNFMLLAEPVRPGTVPSLLKRYDAELPGAEHVAWGIDSVDGSAGAEDELTAAGFEIGRDAVLTATAVRPPARPAAADLRPLAGAGDWRQLLDLRIACYPVNEHNTLDFLTGNVASARALAEGGHATWYGAFTAGVLRSALGLVLGGDLARFQSVETHPDSRRNGLASALVHHAAQDGFDRGARTLVIVADPEYHAIGIYRSLGFEGTETQVQLTRPPRSSTPG
jgi:ribosomal protein S18 acetylase RimI-like enzyme